MAEALDINLNELEKDWQAGMKPSDLARKYGCNPRHLYTLRRRYNLQVKMKNGIKEPAAPSHLDEYLSGESLELSPWVVARISEIQHGK